MQSRCDGPRNLANRIGCAPKSLVTKNRKKETEKEKKREKRNPQKPEALFVLFTFWKAQMCFTMKHNRAFHFSRSTTVLFHKLCFMREKPKTPIFFLRKPRKTSKIQKPKRIWKKTCAKEKLCSRGGAQRAMRGGNLGTSRGALGCSGDARYSSFAMGAR